MKNIAALLLLGWLIIPRKGIPLKGLTENEISDLGILEMKEKIRKKIQRIQNIGYSKKEATAIVERALKLVAEGKKKITDVID